MEKEAPSLPHDGSTCTWIHVRRGDSQSESKNRRKFQSLSEYLERGSVPQGETVLLLTDDEAAISPDSSLSDTSNSSNFGKLARSPSGSVPLK